MRVFLVYKGGRWNVKLSVQASGPNGEVQLKLADLSTVEVGGISGVAVKCIDITQNSDCEGSSPDRD